MILWLISDLAWISLYPKRDMFAATMHPSTSRTLPERVGNAQPPRLQILDPDQVS